MKYLLKPLAILMFLSPIAMAEKDEDQSAKIKELSTAFWNDMSGGEYDAAKKSIFTKSDDPGLEKGEFFAKMVADEFDDLVKHLKELKEEAKLKEVTVRGIGEKRGRQVAAVVLMVWEPKEREYERLTIAWLKTEKAGWKLVDL